LGEKYTFKSGTERAGRSPIFILVSKNHHLHSFMTN